MPILVLGAESQFYFVGKTVVSNDPIPNARHVYLRWDVVEGQLPSDVIAFRLIRNGEKVLGEWKTNAVMDSPAIAELYRGADHQRRKLETITRLNELASDQGNPFSASQFSKSLYELINPASATYNPLWAFLGSRTDFNIARARFHGWVDTDPVTEGGMAKYELLGVNESGVTVRLGYVEVDPAGVQQPLGATELRQIRVSDWRCDLPESSKDQYTVMLDWKSPGEQVISDRVAAQSYNSGFDLYRTTDNLAPNVVDAPVQDIAALAAAAPSDSRGRPVIAGLEKVNVSLIIDSGAPAYDPEWIAARQRLVEGGFAVPDIADFPGQNIPMEPKWLEARDLLIRAGLKPGDRRAYYIVPRDFTGNYGPTVGAVVEVPLMTRPPAPWNLRTFADETSSAIGGAADAFAITWDEVDLFNYMKMYSGTRLFCNTVEAGSTGVLEYVAKGESCETGDRFAVRVDVPEYRVYRFTDFDVAGRFKDSDGDGVEDSAETPDIDGNGRIDAYERSAGLQCDATAQPPGADNYLVGSKEGGSIEFFKDSIFNPAPPNIIRMRDTVPAINEDPIFNRDKVYWYRIVSEATLTPNDVKGGIEPFIGRLSHMSAPQRGLFPDRDLPPEPIISVTKPGPNIVGCELQSDPTAPWSFSESVSDEKDPGGTAFTVSCSAGPYVASDIAAAGAGSCPDVVNNCVGADPVFIQFPATANTGGKACTVPIPADVSICETGGLQLVPEYEGIPLQPGDLVFGGATPSGKPPLPGTCIAFYENLDGSVTRIGSTCDPGGLKYTSRHGLFCGYAVVSDENNNISTTVQFPCTLSPSQPKTPSPPQVLTLNVDDNFARFTFRLPAEQVAMAMVRLEYEPGVGNNARTIEAIPVIDNEPGEAISFSVPVDPLSGNKDRYCLSLMSIGSDDGTGSSLSSDWSSEKCFTRTAIGEDIPKYLPWPAVQGAEQGEPLVAALISDYRSVQPFLSIWLAESPDLVVENPTLQVTDCWVLQPGQLNVNDPPAADESLLRDFDSYQCLSGGVARFRSALAPEMRFVLYRQSRVNGGKASDWIQVSPLIDYIHFDREVVTFGDNDFTIWTLNDPFFRVVMDGANLAILYVDQYPFLIDADITKTQPYEWRYQTVYFDEDHRPAIWRATDWFREAQE
jgi:hypothetical protein